MDGATWVFRPREQGGASRGRKSVLVELDARIARGEIAPEEYAALGKLLAG